MRNIALIFISLVAIIVGMLLLQTEPHDAPLPWQTQLMPDGNIEIFNLHLGTSTYQQAQHVFHDYGHAAIFTENEQSSSVEVFFDSVNLAGLSAKVVLTLSVTESEITSMLSRANKSTLQASGARKHEIVPRDIKNLLNKPITSLSYIPAIKLDKATVRLRFGEPNTIQHHSETMDETWLYPAIGLTVYLNEGEKTVLQFQSIT